MHAIPRISTRQNAGVKSKSGVVERVVEKCMHVRDLPVQIADKFKMKSFVIY